MADDRDKPFTLRAHDEATALPTIGIFVSHNELPDIWVAASSPAGAKALRDYLVRPIIRETVMKRISEAIDALEVMDTLEDFERSR